MTPICLLFGGKKSYISPVPICPKCSATIHAGAEDQCPACGYSLHRADVLFGEGQVEFTRVVDAAGALRHQERMDLMRALEDLERDLPPIALCIYITDEGKMPHFRTHAHWILNHARIHHPSFGPREKNKALDDAELRERRPGESIPPQKERKDSRLTHLAHSIREYWRNATRRYAKPVKHEWMLILVLDVQLEVACFSWGYMLDPYINPDSINSCIRNARLQFRERATVTALKRVMRAAVRQIAAGSRKVNKQLEHALRSKSPLLLLLIAAGLVTASPVCLAAPVKAGAARASTAKSIRSTAKKSRRSSAKSATSSRLEKRQSPRPATANPAGSNASAPASSKRSPAPPPVFQDDETAEEVEPLEETSPPAPHEESSTPSAPIVAPPSEAKPPSQPGAAASFKQAPRWKEEDYKMLMAGELARSYTALFPAREKSASSGRTAPRKTASSRVKSNESDTKVPGRYFAEYTRDFRHGLCDPQGLLSTIEREDVEHTLRELNANSRFKVYIAVYKGSQEIPNELSVSTIVTAVAQPGEYAVMIMYPLGNPALLELGYQEIKTDDEMRHRWLRLTRDKAVSNGDNIEGIMAAARQIHASVTPLSASFRDSVPGSAIKPPLVNIHYRPDTKEKKKSLKERMSEALENQTLTTCLELSGGALLPLGLYLLYAFCVRRRTGRLLESPADVRLSSPYGASISRYVRYMEGKEARKEKNIF